MPLYKIIPDTVEWRHLDVDDYNENYCEWCGDNVINNDPCINTIPNMVNRCEPCGCIPSRCKCPRHFIRAMKELIDNTKESVASL